MTHGTNRFSDYLTDPIKRLGFTASFVLGMTYGSTPVADKLAGAIRAMHERVRGTMPDGRSFSATDSGDIAWVGEAVRFLRRPYGTARATRASSLLLSRVATDLVPAWARELLGLCSRVPLAPYAHRAAGEALMRTLRYGVCTA